MDVVAATQVAWHTHKSNHGTVAKSELVKKNVSMGTPTMHPHSLRKIWITYTLSHTRTHAPSICPTVSHAQQEYMNTIYMNACALHPAPCTLKHSDKKTRASRHNFEHFDRLLHHESFRMRVIRTMHHDRTQQLDLRRSLCQTPLHKYSGTVLLYAYCTPTVPATLETRLRLTSTDEMSTHVQ